MDKITIYHNPRCAKSREALQLLLDKGEEVLIVEYLKVPPTKAKIKELLLLLGMKPLELVRKGEQVYKDHYAGKMLTDAQWIDALAEYPVLMERPVIVRGSKAVIGRPPENALEV